MTAEPASPVFGSAPPGIICAQRRAAYAVIPRIDGRIAAVCAAAPGRQRYWLPGGGVHAGETPEEAVVREVREELGRGVVLLGRIGQAIQYFGACAAGRWYEMKATFVHARFEGDATGAGEHELHWLDAQRQAGLFYHDCHAWAAQRACLTRS